MSTMPSSPDTFTWLHITDLHFGLKGQAHLWPNLRQPFFADLAKMLEKTGRIDAMLFTGDLVQQGKAKEFADMQAKVLERLWQILAQHGSGAAVLLAVPGNHDLVRPKLTIANSPVVKALLAPGLFSGIASDFWGPPQNPYRKVIDKAFVNYSVWWQAASQRASGITPGIIPGDFACTLPCGERKIGIIGLNTAFLQLGNGDYHGKLVWDARQLHAVCGGAADDWSNRHEVCLLMTHQGPDWLTLDAQQQGKREIAPVGRFAVHLFGHMHQNNLSCISTGGNPAMVRQWQATSLFGMEKYGEPPKEMRRHGYAIGQIRFEAHQASLRMWPRRVADDPSGWRFVADVDGAVLGADEGTTPEVIQVRACAPVLPPTTAGSAEESSEPTRPALPTDHPQQQALRKLEEALAEDWPDQGAAPFLQVLCRKLRLPASAELATCLAALAALPGGLQPQLHTIQYALVQQKLPLAGESHVIERLAGRLYFRAAILAVRVAEVEAVCTNLPELTEVFHDSAALIAVLMAVLQAENHEIDWADKATPSANPGQRLKSKTMLRADVPPDPLQQTAALAKEAVGVLDPGFGFNPDINLNAEQLREMQQHIKARAAQHHVVFGRQYRFVVDDPQSRLYQDNRYVADLFASMGIPVTRIVPNSALDIEKILGVPAKIFDDLFVQFLEVLRQAKQSGVSPTS